jgi:hypothetical protein
LRGEVGVVDEIGIWCDGVREGLEVDGRCGHLLFCGLEKKGDVNVTLNGRAE